jgi:hypothetical protein
MNLDRTNNLGFLGLYEGAKLQQVLGNRLIGVLENTGQVSSVGLIELRKEGVCNTLHREHEWVRNEQGTWRK